MGVKGSYQWCGTSYQISRCGENIANRTGAFNRCLVFWLRLHAGNQLTFNTHLAQEMKELFTS